MALTDLFSFVFCDWVAPSSMNIFEFALPLYTYALYEVGVCMSIHMHVHAHTYVFIRAYLYKNIILSTDCISIMFD